MASSYEVILGYHKLDLSRTQQNYLEWREQPEIAASYPLHNDSRNSARSYSR